jgi:hypothetical protein
MRWSVMIFFSVMILGGCNREPSSVRTADGYIYPQVPFDVSTAQAMLQPGECELRGTAVAKEADRTPIMIVNLSTGHDAPPGTCLSRRLGSAQKKVRTGRSPFARGPCVETRSAVWRQR